MTINWFSLPDQAAEVLPLLTQRAEVIAWTHEPDSTPMSEQLVEVRRYDPMAMPWVEINAADATVYHLGAEAVSYGPIWQVARRHPGIVILHDLNLQPLFADLTRKFGIITEEEYLQIMEFHHPNGGRHIGEAILSGRTAADELGADYRLTGAVFENALGVIVRKAEASTQLGGGSGVPLLQLPFPGKQEGAEENFVDGLMKLLEAVAAAGPREASRWVSGRAGQALRPWFSHKTARVLLPPLAAAISDLFDPGQPPLVR